MAVNKRRSGRGGGTKRDTQGSLGDRDERKDRGTTAKRATQRARTEARGGNREGNGGRVSMKSAGRGTSSAGMKRAGGRKSGGKRTTRPGTARHAARR